MAWLEAARRIVERHAAERLLPDGTWTSDLGDWPEEWEEIIPGPADGPAGILLDLYTASMLVQVHDALGLDNREKFAGFPLEQAVALGWKLVQRAVR